MSGLRASARSIDGSLQQEVVIDGDRHVEERIALDLAADVPGVG